LELGKPVNERDIIVDFSPSSPHPTTTRSTFDGAFAWASGTIPGNELDKSLHQETAMDVTRARDAMAGKTHLLRSGPDTVHWGYLDGALNPALASSISSLTASAM